MTGIASRLSGAPPPPRDDDEAPIHVLVVDDEPALRKNLGRILTARGFVVGTAEDGEQGLEYVETKAPDVALVDIMMPKMNGLEVLTRAKHKGLATEFVMMTATAGLDEAVAAVKLGAYHFLTKPFDSNEVVNGDGRAGGRAQEAGRSHAPARTEARGARALWRAHWHVGEDERGLSVDRGGRDRDLDRAHPGRERYREGARCARDPSAIRACQQALRRRELRSDSEGSRRERALWTRTWGVYWGTERARGALRDGTRGTIFLDEVGDLPLVAQVKLLRTLQEGEVKRVGSDETKIVDVRVLAATNVDLKSLIDAGAFRTDLFYRLNVIGIALPPLRERKDDILLLAYHFIDKYARRMGRDPKRLGPDAARALTEYPWPGNVRELEHAMERAVVLAQGVAIAARDLPAETQGEAGRYLRLRVHHRCQGRSRSRLFLRTSPLPRPSARR